MNITDNIQIEEILWTLLTIPGLIFWSINARTAYQTLQAVKKLRVDNGRHVWSKFSLQLTGVFVTIELIFIFIGINSMVRPVGTSDAFVIHWIVVGLAILATAILTWVGLRWRAVDAYLLATAVRRDVELKAADQEP